MDIQRFFSSHARISRKALARFAEVDAADLDAAADGLGCGPLLRLDEAEEVLDELAADDDGEDDEDEDASNDDESDPDDEAQEDDT
jgi:hypothetical protein